MIEFLLFMLTLSSLAQTSLLITLCHYICGRMDKIEAKKRESGRCDG